MAPAIFLSSEKEKQWVSEHVNIHGEKGVKQPEPGQ